jgi:nitrite reductase/ring-hydroxylating ferredoxin subunit
MAKPTLSMTPTGWFQVAWSSEIGVGDVRRLHYFGSDLVAWRGESGEVAVMDAYCMHLGAHLGYGGTVVEDTIQCPFHGWQWNRAGRNVCIPYADRPNLGRKIRSYPSAERNDAIYIWHDVQRRAPFFDVPDVFTGWEDATTADDYHSCATLFDPGLELHPQYVLENGVDPAHFTFVHKIPIVPIFTRQDFDEPVSFVDFTVSFDSSVTSADEINSGVHAINAGVGLAVTKSWGMVDNRTATAVTPVDDRTCDVRFSVWIGRTMDGRAVSAEAATRHAQGVIDQFRADVEIWSHQRYTDPAGLVLEEYPGYTALRAWAQQFYPEPATV